MVKPISKSKLPLFMFVSREGQSGCVKKRRASRSRDSAILTVPWERLAMIMDRFDLLVVDPGFDASDKKCGGLCHVSDASGEYPDAEFGERPCVLPAGRRRWQELRRIHRLIRLTHPITH